MPTSNRKVSNVNQDPVAIIGIGCRFPGGAHDPESFWKILSTGADCVCEVPKDRFSVELYHSPNRAFPGTTVSKWGGFVEQRIEDFDAQFFGMSPREAASLDPMQRWLLEVAWEALEDAGVVPARIAGSNTAVFIGGFTEDIKLLQMSPDNRNLISMHSATGSAMTMLANRLSYVFDLNGPSVALDTACSSSLVAVHLACQSLWTGESSLALAGGVNVMFRPEYTIAESKAGMLSPTGRSKAFDSRADGYVRGEGAGIIVLKPLHSALADGDPIYAVIRGSGVNQDGRTNGITVPNGATQAQLVQEVCRRACVVPSEVHYVEAHGTGTPVGDPIEANSLGSALGKGRKKGDECWIGSVKTNIGHLEAAAGIAGLIKTALSLHHAAIPPHLHLLKVNPNIDFPGLGLRVPTTLEPWPEKPGPRLAAVNSFGFGGTSAHVILQSSPRIDGRPATGEGPRGPIRRKELVTLSAKSDAALGELATRMSTWIAQSTDDSDRCFSDLSYSTMTRRTHHDHRLALVASDLTELSKQLTCYAAGDLPATGAAGKRAREAQRLVFVFGGMGPQWWGMGRQLLEENSVYRAAVEQIDAKLMRLSGWSLMKQLLADERSSRMGETCIRQPANFALQIGLWELWKSYGITPNAIVGHSAGEVAAAYAAGVYTLDDAVKIIYERSRIQHKTTGLGRMMALSVTEAEAQSAISRIASPISIAAINSPNAVTLVGEEQALEELALPYRERGVFARYLQVDVPYHSYFMDPLRDELLDCLSAIKPQQTKIPLYSTVTGAISNGPEWTAEYWWQNVRKTVAFAQAALAQLDQGFTTFLELGPHPVLAASIQECASLRQASISVMPSLRRNACDRTTLLSSLAQLYVNGIDPDFTRVAPANGTHISLPTYPWQRQAHWLESTASRTDRLGEGRHAVLGRRSESTSATWEKPIDIGRDVYIADHVIGGKVVYPAAGYVNDMLAAAQECLAGAVGKIELCGISFEKALFLPSDSHVSLRVECDERGNTTLSSRTDEQPWSTHARGRFRARTSSSAHQAVSLADLRAAHPHAISRESVYAQLHKLGFEYGPQFAGMSSLWRGELSVFCNIKLSKDSAAAQGTMPLHPALLDSCFQTLLTALFEPGQASSQGLYLPTGIDKLILHAPVTNDLWVQATVLELTEKRLRGELTAFDSSGNLLFEVRGIVAKSLDHIDARSPTAQELLYDIAWEPQLPLSEGPQEPQPQGRWLLLADRKGHAAMLQARLQAEGESCILAYPDVLMPARPQHLEDLVRRMLSGANHAPFRGIVHMWGLDAPSLDETDEAALEQSQQQGPIALLQLVQALDRSGELTLPKIWIVTRGTQAVDADTLPTTAASASLWGMARVIAYQEHPSLFGGLIDLDIEENSEDLAMLARELLTGAVTDQVAYRKGRRFAPRMLPTPQKLTELPPCSFSENGAYLITGGLGGLGLTVARWLVAQGARRLILLGRTALPERHFWSKLPASDPAAARVSAICELESQGAAVHVAAVDVANRQELASFLARYKAANYPRIRGIIHAAGLSEPKLLVQLSEEQYHRVARPKILGGLHLHQLTAHLDLDFFVMFSSVAAHAMTAGQADYAAANAFLDALALCRRKMGLPATSINWGAWAEAGMATQLGTYFDSRGIPPFSPEVALSALSAVILRDSPQQIALWISDTAAFAQRNFATSEPVPFIERLLVEEASPSALRSELSDATSALTRILLAPTPELRLSQIHSYLIDRVTRALRLTSGQLQSDMSLRDLGIDSLLAVELKNRISTDLKVAITVVDLLGSGRIAELVQIIDSALAQSGNGYAANAPIDEVITGPVPLTPNQHWFVDRKLPNPHHWNIALMLDVVTPLDFAVLQQAVQVVMRHHDALRTRFSTHDGLWSQHIALPSDETLLHRVDLSHLTQQAQESELEHITIHHQKQLNLFTGPVVALVYFNRGVATCDRLLVTVHHLIADVASVRIVIDDLLNAYRCIKDSAPVALPPKTTSYKQFAETLINSIALVDHEDVIRDWQDLPWKQIDSLPIDLPRGRERNTIDTTRIVVSALEAHETNALLQMLPGTLGVSTQVALLSAFAHAFSRAFGVNALLMDVIIHGRNAPFDAQNQDLARTVGLFAHGVPWILSHAPDTNLEALLDETARAYEAFTQRAKTYGSLRWLSRDPRIVEYLKDLPRREVIFNYVGQLELPSSAAELVSVTPRIPKSLEDGRNARDFLLQCQLGISRGRLTAFWNFSDAVYREETIQELSHIFQQTLRAFVQLAILREPAVAE